MGVLLFALCLTLLIIFYTKKTGALPSKCTGLARKIRRNYSDVPFSNKLSHVCYAYIINCAKIQKRCRGNINILLKRFL
jgi:hypothetical protein